MTSLGVPCLERGSYFWRTTFLPVCALSYPVVTETDNLCISEVPKPAPNVPET